jgi:hypothetical protein
MQILLHMNLDPVGYPLFKNGKFNRSLGTLTENVTRFSASKNTITNCTLYRMFLYIKNRNLIPYLYFLEIGIGKTYLS